MSNKDNLRRGKEITDLYFEILDKHINDVVSGKTLDFMEINQIANTMFISHKHLTDTIQKETGSHPCHFYDLKIIDQAKKLLSESNKSASETARILTYDPSNFSKFFKKFTGQTPGQFKEENKK